MVRKGTRLLQSTSVEVTTLAAIKEIEDQSATEPVLGKVHIIAPSSILNGQRTVPTAGTAVSLGSGAILSVTVKALHGNTGMIYVGNAEVSSTNGYVLEAGEPISLDVDNLNDVYIDADVGGEGVSWIAVVK